MEEMRDEEDITVIQQRLEALRAAEYLYENVSEIYVTPRVAETDNALEKHVKTVQFAGNLDGFNTNDIQQGADIYTLPWNTLSRNQWGKPLTSSAGTSKTNIDTPQCLCRYPNSFDTRRTTQTTRN
eukprot:PhF_6_TR37570/c0_g2_i15/m.55692